MALVKIVTFKTTSLGNMSVLVMSVLGFGTGRT